MTTLHTTFLALLLAIQANCAFAAEAYIGRFLYQYAGGSTYRVTVNDDTHMQWACIQGPEKGASGIETPQRFKINKQVFFATWVEKTGINVSQVVDFKHMKVYSTIVDGKERYVLEGNIVREK